MQHSILIIEDHQNIALVLQEYLNDHDLYTEVAINGRDAVEKFRRKKYDVLITDVKLPDLDGKVVVKNCKKISPNVRVIYITGYHLEFKKLKFQADPYCQVIEKPCRPKIILEAVQKILK